MMKKIYLYLLIALLGLVSCEKYLDVNPEMGISEEEVFSDYYNYRGAVDRAHYFVIDYLYYPHFKTRDYVPGGISDEMHTCNPASVMGIVNRGDWISWQPSNFGVGDYGFGLNKNSAGEILPYENSACGLSAYGIRAANLAIANIDLLKTFPSGSDPQQLKNELLGQSYFLRAWFYFELIRRMGPLGEMRTVFTPETDFDETRPTYQQCTDWLVEDLNMAIELLPAKWDDANGGRPTKLAAESVKAMALLYAASPNMNLPYGVDPVGGEGYNPAYLDSTVVASVAAIKRLDASPEYEMYTWGDGGAEYEKNFYSKDTKYSKEAIFAIMPKEKTNNNSNTGRGGWRLQYDNGYAKHQVAPTQNMVDMYETFDGYAIEDAPSTSYDPQDPYAKRDPRLRMAIYVNGDNLYLKNDAKNPIFSPYMGGEGVDDGFHYNYMIGEKKLQWTGYELRGKLRWRGQNNQDQVSGYNRFYPFIRIPQLYLDLAEAANELYGPTGVIPGASEEWNTAEKCINIIRARVEGFSPVNAIYTGDKDAFRPRVRNERAVELFLEFHRWHDIRRWRIAKEALSEIRGVSIIKNADGSFTYDSRVIPNARTFEDRHYWYPFTYGVRDMMSVFEQNPGW